MQFTLERKLSWEGLDDLPDKAIITPAGTGITSLQLIRWAPADRLLYGKSGLFLFLYVHE